MQALVAEAAALGLALSADQVAQFSLYKDLLQSWNRRINLTSVDDDAGIRRRHFLDSLSCARVTGDLTHRRLIDVGTGAGFPGIPLKILYPEMPLTLVESVGKKVDFLNTVLQELDIVGANVVGNRAETVGQMEQFREQYDWAVARAVASLNVLVEYLLPLCRVGGQALAMKSESAPAEAKTATPAIATLGGTQPRFHQIQLPGRVERSYLVVVGKVAPTPPAYPRRPGMPAKRPL